MPEIVEVEQARAVIAAHALGREIAAVDDSDAYVCRPHGSGEIAGALIGRALVDACRRGKAMWVTTDANGPILGLHLGMGGRILVETADGGRAVAPGNLRSAPLTPRNAAWDRFTITFADGGTLRLRDKRRLGRARLEPDLSRVGPDAEHVDRDTFIERVGRSGAPVKARLMDQAVISGVGNLLADETLWQAKISPARPANDLDLEELAALRRAMRRATRAAIKGGGVHTGRIIEHRRPGASCPRCGAPMIRGKVGGRTTWWCEAEQGDMRTTPGAPHSGL